MSSFEQRSCFSCENPVDDQPCRYCTCERCGYYNRGVPCLGCNSEAENSFTYEPTPYSYNDSPNFSDYPPQPQYDTYFCELCGNDAHYGYDCPPQVPFNCPAFYDNDDEDDDEEYTIIITPVLPTVLPDNSLSMGDEHLSTIPKKKESSVEDLVPIQSSSA
ncbi:hypothetical protein Tco_1125753 [Tanacetum coccineum]